MQAKVASNPPLAQPTVISSNEDALYRAKFHVALSLDHAQKLVLDQEWHVEVWHDHASRDSDDAWTSLSLERCSAKLSECQNCFIDKLSCTNLWFEGTLKGLPRTGNKTRFTIRFCYANEFEQDKWRWAADGGGTDDGILLYQPPGRYYPPLQNLESYIPSSLNEELEIMKRTSETPYTYLWLITAPNATAAHGNTSGWSCWNLGRPRQVHRWFSLTRISTPWLGPRQGNDELADGESLLYSFMRDDGLHVVMLALSGIQADGNVQTVLCRSEDRKGLVMAVRNDEEDTRKGRLVVSVGRSFQYALAAVMYEARKLVTSLLPPVSKQLEGRPSRSLHSKVAVTKYQTVTRALPDLHNKWYLEWMDGLIYCTWNSLGLEVSETKILNALKSLHRQGITISTLIIDDGWQSVDKPSESNMKQGWSRFEANGDKFPTGLKGLVAKVRSQHPSVKNVVVWHALLGYWSGIDPGGEIARKYRTRTINIRNGAMISDGCMTIVDHTDANALYTDFYAFLEDSGVTGVKTDVQFALDEISDPEDRRELTVTYAHAWQNAYLRFFAGRAISCMSQTPSLIFSLYLRNDIGPEIPMRNSDDFIPGNEDCQPWHVWCNAHNAVLSTFLNVLPDWDMFQTAHPWSGWHAAARCISGGPICITDVPEHHDASLLKSICAPTPNGKTVVLRPDVCGRTAKVYSKQEDDGFCRISSFHGRSTTGTSILGLFNLKRWQVNEVLLLCEFAGILPNTDYVVRSLRTGKARGPLRSGDAFAISMKGHDWDVITTISIKRLQTLSTGVANVHDILIAPLGLLNHVVGTVALVGFHCEIRQLQPGTPGNDGIKSSSRIHATIQIKALGELGVWMTLGSQPSIMEDMMVLMEEHVMPSRCVRAEKADEGSYIVIMDIAEAWKQLAPAVRGLSNEVKISMSVRI